MSYDPSDAAWDAYLEQLYEEHRGEAVEEFRAERLGSYYSQNRFVAQPAIGLLEEAERILAYSARSSLVLATAAAEVAIKSAILKPMIVGLVHSANAAGLVTELTISHTGIDRFATLLGGIVSEHVGADIATYHARDEVPVLQDLAVVQRLRNGVLHQGGPGEDEDAHLAIAVAHALLDKLFPDVLTGVGLHEHDGAICELPKWRCDLRQQGY